MPEKQGILGGNFGFVIFLVLILLLFGGIGDNY